MTEGKIEVKNLSFKYSGPNEYLALKDLNFTVKPKEFTTLLGPSGCGKSTTLHIISGLIKPTNGNILIDNKEINAPSKNVQLVFQQPLLFPWKSVQQNIAFSLKTSETETKTLLEKYLSLTSLQEFRHFYPHQLSLGMQQKASLARAFISNPSVLLMDEPFRSIDYQKRLELHEFLLDLTKKLSKTVLFVTHDIDEAILLSDRILIMTPSPGAIKEEIKINLDNRSTRLLTKPKFAKYKEKIIKGLRIP